MVPHLTSHSDSCDVGGDPEHGKTVRMLSQHYLSPSFLPSSEHLFHSGICQVSMMNAYLVSRVQSPNWYQLSCRRQGSGLYQKEVDMKKKQRKDTWQTGGSGRYPKRTKNRGTLGEIQRKALVSSWLPQAMMPIIALLLWPVPHN